MNSQEWKELCLARELLKGFKIQIHLIINSNTYKERTKMGFDYVEQGIDSINEKLMKYYRRLEA